MTKSYTPLTDSQWNSICEIFSKRQRKLNLRDVVNALLYMVRVGCQWRNLPREYPHWTAVNYYFERWTELGLILKMNTILNELDRLQEERTAGPSLLCIDSQSVKLNPMLEKDRGIDCNKRVNGRKRQILVDTAGRVLGVDVHAANIADGKGAVSLVTNLKKTHKQPRKNTWR